MSFPGFGLVLLFGFVGFVFACGCFCFCSCFWTSSLLRISLLSNSSRSVDRPCHELDRHSRQKNFYQRASSKVVSAKTFIFAKPTQITSYKRATGLLEATIPGSYD